MTPILKKKKLHWLPVRHCIVYKILSLVYKAINGAVPCCISDLLNYRTSERTLRSSFQHLLATPKARLKTCGERTFPVAGPGLWNSIPLELRSSSSIDIFKRHFKTYLFKQVHNSLQFYQMINMFHYSEFFNLFIPIYKCIFFLFVPLFFQVFFLYDLNVKHHGQLVDWRCINIFTIIIYNTCTYDVRKNSLTLVTFLSSIQERRKRMLVLVKALLGIENS